MEFPALSPRHHRRGMEQTLGSVVKVAAALQAEPAKLAACRIEMNALIGRHLEGNVARHPY